MIHPIRDQRYWEPDQFHKLDPPPLRRMPGRPRKNRRREADEAPAGASHMKRSQTLRCTNCKEFGHNRRTCQRAPVKKKKGANSQHAGSRGRGRTNGRGRGRGRNASVTQNEGGRGSNEVFTVLSFIFISSLNCCCNIDAIAQEEEYHLKHYHLKHFKN
ncbi:hypothetical protein RHGRI_015138 [Rhododendron griersonianum]|uniref:CCHC-type domain-containing protein n=1 Tax=Rhododendron griersonianum TaxID=479676 RepID=A0AAV6KCR9_9ERIC|nr:hypothetical protein RHGRI_015138 [Rhododendron griersonianum]